jgi:uncharacterized membrane protein YedE/YeeE
MMAGENQSQKAIQSRSWPFWAFAILGIGFIVAAFVTNRWFLSAFPIGLLFGFFLQKGDLCGASAFSEVLLMRDGRKVFGLWAGIIISMLGFAAVSLLGLVSLSPKPLLWVNDIAGGLIFGAGTVLAGGCISGCLYKSAMGNVNSIVALLTIPLGIAFVEHGPLTGWAAKMKAVKTTASGGGPVTLSSLSGLPFWSWALIFAFLTAALVLLRRKKRDALNSKSFPPAPAGKSRSLLTNPWKPWQAGIAVGLVVVVSLFSSAAAGRNYPIGVTHGVLHIQELLTESNLVHIAGPAAKAVPSPTVPGTKKITWWLVLVVFGTFLGAFASASLSGRVRLQPKPPEQIVTALLGGFLVGAGAALATGCVVGNIMSGWPLLSVGMILFGIAVILANWATTYLFMMGGRLAELPETLRLMFKRSC